MGREIHCNVLAIVTVIFRVSKQPDGETMQMAVCGRREYAGRPNLERGKMIFKVSSVRRYRGARPDSCGGHAPAQQVLKVGSTPTGFP